MGCKSASAGAGYVITPVALGLRSSPFTAQHGPFTATCNPEYWGSDQASDPMQDWLLAHWRVYDASIQKAVFGALTAVGFGSLTGPPSKITKDLPFADSPAPAVTTIAAYLVVVTLGAAFLRLRRQPISQSADPGWLRFVVQVHNAVLIALSAGMAASAIYWARRGRYNFWGNAYKPSETEMGLTIYVFYMSKFYEFFDTIIMLLKSKWQQISLLHVYHHASISFICLLFVRPQFVRARSHVHLLPAINAAGQGPASEAHLSVVGPLSHTVPDVPVRDQHGAGMLLLLLLALPQQHLGASVLLHDHTASAIWQLLPRQARRQTPVQAAPQWQKGGMSAQRFEAGVQDGRFSQGQALWAISYLGVIEIDPECLCAFCEGRNSCATRKVPHKTAEYVAGDQPWGGNQRRKRPL